MSDAEIAADADEIEESENTRSGGSTLTEATDVAVSATGPVPGSAVMTATPPGCPRNSDLKSCAVKSAPMCGARSTLRGEVRVMPEG